MDHSTRPPRQPLRRSFARGPLVPLVPVVVVVVVAALVVVALAVLSPGRSAPSALAPSAAPAPTQSTLPTVPVPAGRADALRFSLTEPTRAWREGDAEPDYVALQALLDRRAAAAVEGDVEGYVDTGLVDATARPQAESIAALPVSSWSYTLGRPGGGGAALYSATVAARQRYGPNSYVLRATLRYALEGIDRTEVTTAHAVTVAYQGEGWRIIDDLPLDGSKELWDFGGLRVINGERSVVVGLGTEPPSGATLNAYADAADVGVRDVTEVWGPDWQRRVLVVAPPTVTAMAKALGRDRERYRQIAAVTTADHGGRTRISRGDRIFLNPSAFAKLGPLGRTIVLRHEITHVAALAASDDRMPTWMEEGFADYVGYRGSGVSEQAILRELTAWVRAGSRPTSLPDDRQYDGDSEELVESYEQSWLAADMIAARYGEDDLVRLYRAMLANTTVDPDNGTEQAFREVLGISFSAFERRWVAEVGGLA